MNLIHIGLPKNGSTSLQSGWSNNKDVNCISDDLTPLIAATRKASISGTDPNDLLALWPNSNDKSINIYSSEGFAGLPWGGNASLEEHDYSRYLFANICNEFISEAKVLILVRSPVKWIKSVYAQMIQEGSNLGFARFVRKQRNYLLSGINISALYGHWSKIYGVDNVVIYPFETLVKTPQLANNELSALFGVSSDMELFAIKAKSNRSLSGDNIQFLRAMSILNKRLLGRSDQMTASLGKLNEDMRLLYRVQLQKNDRSFNLMKKVISPISYCLPKPERDVFKPVLYDCFLAELERSRNFNLLLNTYREDIETFLKGMSV